MKEIHEEILKTVEAGLDEGEQVEEVIYIALVKRDDSAEGTYNVTVGGCKDAYSSLRQEMLYRAMEIM